MNSRMTKPLYSLFALIVLVLAACGSNGSSTGSGSAGNNSTTGIGPSFPQLLAEEIGGQSYYLSSSYQANIAKFDVVILGFWNNWTGGTSAMRNIVTSLKTLNPVLKVGQYTILDETSNVPNSTVDDIRTMLTQSNWWLLNAAGQHVAWTTAYPIWDINFTTWTTPVNGQYFPQWLASRNYADFFQPVPEFDIEYFDNVSLLPPDQLADWKMNGTNQNNTDSDVQTAYRQGEAAEWDAARKLSPNLIMMGNADNDLSSPEYKGKLQGAFLEALMGKSYSIETLSGWGPMMTRYHAVTHNVSAPGIVAFNVWGAITDYSFFRYAYASCLMDNGYFSFTDQAQAHPYSNTPWFDEYNTKLGQAIDPPQTSPTQNGIYSRKFQNGLVLVNPGLTTATINIPPGYKHISGSQDPTTNDGTPVTSNSVQLPGKSGLVLIN